MSNCSESGLGFPTGISASLVRTSARRCPPVSPGLSICERLDLAGPPGHLHSSRHSRMANPDWPTLTTTTISGGDESASPRRGGAIAVRGTLRQQ